MDIEKQRAEFEKVFPCSVGTVLNEYGHYESQINQQDAMIQNISWAVWQAAKASAVPEGFMLVKTSDIAKIAVAVSRVDLMTYSEARPDSEKLAWQDVANKLEAMIEAAQEQNQ